MIFYFYYKEILSFKKQYNKFCNMSGVVNVKEIVTM